MAATADRPLLLEVLGILAAGSKLTLATTQPCALEIMTGAEMPEGFDGVIRVEEALIVKNGEKRFLQINKPLKMWDQVRRKGEDYAVGDLLLRAGEKINASHVLALASQGICQLRVKRPVRIGLISTGSEIVPFNEEPGPGQIRNSTQPFLQAKAQSLNIEFNFIGSVSDSTNDLKRILSEAAASYDVLITTGAVSVGLYDLVPPVLKELGANIHFHKVAMRPGKPLLFADFESGPLVLGFPGNPLSSAVAYRFFLEALLLELMGLPVETGYLLELSEEVKKPEDLCCFWKAKLEQSRQASATKIRALKGQESFRIKPFTEASHWAVFPEGKALYKAGDLVEVFSLDSDF